jgi:hypothetical protein
MRSLRGETFGRAIRCYDSSFLAPTETQPRQQLTRFWFCNRLQKILSFWVVAICQLSCLPVDNLRAESFLALEFYLLCCSRGCICFPNTPMRNYYPLSDCPTKGESLFSFHDRDETCSRAYVLFNPHLGNEHLDTE